MSLLVHLGPALDHVKNLRSFLPDKIGLSTTQKVVVVSVTASLGILGILARYMRRKKQTVDPVKFKRQFGKRLRSGIRSPNGDVISLASSGRKSIVYSTYSDRKQNSVLSTTSEKGSVASGSIASGGFGPAIMGGADATHLTPQQFGVMDFFNALYFSRDSK